MSARLILVKMEAHVRMATTCIHARVLIATLETCVKVAFSINGSWFYCYILCFSFQLSLICAAKDPVSMAQHAI